MQRSGPNRANEKKTNKQPTNQPTKPAKETQDHETEDPVVTLRTTIIADELDREQTKLVLLITNAKKGNGESGWREEEVRRDKVGGGGERKITENASSK